MLIVAAFALLFMNPAEVIGVIFPGADLGDISGFIFLIPMMLATIFPASAVNLSLEGRNNWIMCSLPVSSKTIFNSKIAMSLTLNLPATILVCIALVFALQPDFITAALLLLTPAAYVIFNAVLGMYVNAKFPKYDWESEYKLLKGTSSASVIIMTFGGLTVSIALIFLIVILSAYILWITAAILVLSVIGALVVYRLLCNERLFV
jgi:ABC-2 type transport system permease protein